jgi:hypothetical protein
MSYASRDGRAAIRRRREISQNAASFAPRRRLKAASIAAICRRALFDGPPPSAPMKACGRCNFPIQTVNVLTPGIDQAWRWSTNAAVRVGLLGLVRV